ncbi:MAG: DUF4349 domain-containing protein [Rhizomicrobium sp.]
MNLAAPVPDVAPPPSLVPGISQQFSYSHAWTVEMARAAVAPRFRRARDLCLKDRALDCKLVTANLTSGDDGYVSASLAVQLPHAGLEAFERALLAPVAGEAAGDAAMTSRSTQAQSVETEAGDAGRKAAQLSAYRDRLAEIAMRPNLAIDDIIKLEAERARVEDDLDTARTTARGLNAGIARESVTVQLSERIVPVGPFGRMLQNAGDVLAENAAGAVLFVIAAIPWLPILAAGIYTVSWLWRLFRRRQKAIVPAG